MAKKIAIIQSSYIPWKGYFDIINSVDEFIIFDDVQYTRRDWRNRNLIKTSNGLAWLTVPVEVKGKYYQKINETKIVDNSWQASHYRSICQNYSKAPFFGQYKSWIESLYLNKDFTMLTEMNAYFLEEICKLLGVKTKITFSSDYHVIDGKTERLVSLCEQASATSYLSGPSASNYIDAKLFEEAGIKLTYANYDGYPVYPQLYNGFEHGVSILDLLLNVGDAFRNYMKSFCDEKI